MTGDYNGPCPIMVHVALCQGRYAGQPPTPYHHPPRILVAAISTLRYLQIGSGLNACGTSLAANWNTSALVLSSSVCLGSKCHAVDNNANTLYNSDGGWWQRWMYICVGTLDVGLKHNREKCFWCRRDNSVGCCWRNYLLINVEQALIHLVLIWSYWRRHWVRYFRL